MKEFYDCFNCRRVIPLNGRPGDRCPSCGGTRGEAISAARVDEGMKAGVFFNIDPKTGKRAKRKKR